ncbi:crooked neck-like protein 1 [Cololabis saira]|uniref:crooked neck-like protein 1 n=1 Tax=Cololabis saira TaxID=129043 RepID=UPI002AD4FF55|nr:crooked neck-like protein 1 [Cololabis saira]
MASTAAGKQRIPEVAKVKNEAPAEVQITAEQLLREAKERELELLPPKQEITVKEELNDSKLRKRKVNLLPGSVILKQTPQFSVLTSR